MGTKSFKLAFPCLESCLDELEREFLRIGREVCNDLYDPSQLSSFLRLGLRATSLLRGMKAVLGTREVDAYPPIQRAFWETWILQLEMRMKCSEPKAAKWFYTKNQEWEPDIPKCKRFVKGLGHGIPGFGKEYGALSELAHPTFIASENSCSAAAARTGDAQTGKQIESAVEAFSKDLSGLLMREIWLVDASHNDLIDLPIKTEKLVKCDAVFREFEKSGKGD